MIRIADIAFDPCGNDFLIPYVRRAFGVGEDDEPLPVRAVVRVVQGAGDPSAESDPSVAPGCPVLTLRCPAIVGTGMTGSIARRIAESLYDGRFVHIRDNVTHVSVVHAVDVAAAVALAAGISDDLTLTDGADPTVHDLAEALSYRLGDKRILTIKAFWARLWLGRSFFTALTTDAVVADTFCRRFPDFRPHEVTTYLRTHVYDESSL